MKENKKLVIFSTRMKPELVKKIKMQALKNDLSVQAYLTIMVEAIIKHSEKN